MTRPVPEPAADPGRRRRRVRWAVAVAVPVAAWLGASYLVAAWMTGRPAPLAPEPLPDVAWGRPEAFRLATADGEDLGAWYFPGRPDRPPVLVVHGNAANRTACLPEAELAAVAGHPVLLVTVRAHGDSTGDRNDFGWSARADVEAAVGWLAGRHPGRPAVVWGRSLGAAAAVFAAPEVGDRVCGYVLECPYRDLRSATRNRTRAVLPPGVEWVAYAGLSAVAPAVGLDPAAIDPATAAAAIPPAARVLVLAGGADRRATPADAAAVAARAGPRAELVVVPGGGHLGLAAADPGEYRRAVLGFLDRCSGAGP